MAEGTEVEEGDVEAGGVGGPRKGAGAPAEAGGGGAGIHVAATTAGIELSEREMQEEAKRVLDVSARGEGKEERGRWGRVGDVK